MLPAFQGRGLASRAAALVLERAAREGKHRFIIAGPAVDDAASNAVCARLGFELVETGSFQYPPGQWMLCNIWRLDLLEPRSRRA